MPRRAVIKFYRTGDPFGEFSNFAAFPIRLKGVEWPTNEYRFPAQNVVSELIEELVIGVKEGASTLKLTGMNVASPSRNRISL